MPRLIAQAATRAPTSASILPGGGRSPVGGPQAGADLRRAVAREQGGHGLLERLDLGDLIDEPPGPVALEDLADHGLVEQRVLGTTSTGHINGIGAHPKEYERRVVGYFDRALR